MEWRRWWRRLFRWRFWRRRWRRFLTRKQRFPMNEGAKMTSKLWFAGVTLLFATVLNGQQPPANRPQPKTPPATGQPASPSTPGKPDITSTNRGIILGGAVGGARGKFVPWGGFADLSDVEPLSGTIAN